MENKEYYDKGTMIDEILREDVSNGDLLGYMLIAEISEEQGQFVSTANSMFPVGKQWESDVAYKLRATSNHLGFLAAYYDLELDNVFELVQKAYLVHLRTGSEFEGLKIDDKEINDNGKEEN